MLFRSADGSRFGLLISAAVIDPLQGDFIGVVMERGHLSSASGQVSPGTGLHESLLDSLPLLVARFDRFSELTYCNRAFVDWFGFSSAPIGWSLEDLFGAETKGILTAQVDRVLGGATETVEFDFFRVGGRFQRLEIVFAPHRRSDESVGGFVALLQGYAQPTTAADPATAVPVESETTYTV